MGPIVEFTRGILAHWGEYGEGFGPGMMSWGHGYGWIMPLAFVLFWVTVIVGIVLLMRWLTLTGRSGGNAAESAKDILKKRYARGEIGKEEYQEKLRDIEG